MDQKTIIIGSDHAAYQMKETIKAYLENQGYTVQDIGPQGIESVDYPDFGIAVASAIASGEQEKGILMCGTGLGMSMVANRFPGVRAALCNDTFSAALSRRHNDANILVMGGRVIGDVLAQEIVTVWLDTDFEGGRHQDRISKFDRMDAAACIKT